MLKVPNSHVYVPIGVFGGKSEENIIKESEVKAAIANQSHLLEPNSASAFKQLTLFVAFILFANVLLANLPWFLLPVGWALSGLALSGMVVIATDCANNTWTSSSVINTIVGELAFLPVLQPFAYFKLKLKSADPHVSPKNALNDAKDVKLAGMEIASFVDAWSNFKQDFFLNPVPTPLTSHIFLSSILSVSFSSFVLYSLWISGGWFAVTKYVFLPLIVCHLSVNGVYLVLTHNARAWIPSDIATKIASYNLGSFADALSSKITAAKGMDLKQTIQYWLPRIDWLHLIILSAVPMISLYGVLHVPLQSKTLIWAIAYYFLTGIGITGGYHRLWAHRAYEASFPVEFVLMLLGSGALEGSIKWWCGGHRVHHRYTDTEKDPYNANGGFWYAHLGWMLVKPEKKAYSDISDLSARAIVRFQHKYYLFVGPFMAVVFPTLVAGLLWDDWVGGYFYAGACRLFFVHHSTFCVNSVAHYFGAHTYDDKHSPRDSIFTALITLGEGYHNFHHEFPQDYRNGIRLFDYDPTKWTIKFLNMFGLTSNLKTFPHNEILKGQATMHEKKLNKIKELITYPADPSNLPVMSWEELKKNVEGGKLLTVIQGLVHDVTDFIDDHPGGQAILKGAIGIDATARFLGETGIYVHSNAANNLLSNMRVARIETAKSI